MKKGTQIYLVTIDVGNRVSIETSDKVTVKVNRTQRNTLVNWKDNPNYETDVIRAFSNDNILAPGFSIVQNGVVVYKK